MNKAALILWLVGFAAPASAASALIYREAEEQVLIDQQVFSYRPDQRGFVAANGDWAGWDEQAGNWLLRRRSGEWARFDEGGGLLQRSAPHPGKSDGRGYNPAMDVGDTAPGAKPDEQAAWDYLKEQETVLGGRSAPSAGDDGGGAVELGAIGGDQAAREKKLREDWKLTPGAHAADPEAAMETGAPVDPIKKMMDTVRQVRDTVDGVADTISEADALRRQLENPGDYFDNNQRRPRRSGADAVADATNDADSAQGAGVIPAAAVRPGMPSRRAPIPQTPSAQSTMGLSPGTAAAVPDHYQPARDGAAARKVFVDTFEPDASIPLPAGRDAMRSIPTPKKSFSDTFQSGDSP